jgi:hypothetical protein
VDSRRFLITTGRTAGVALYEAASAVECRRGDRAVVRTPRGLELGTVLCAASTEHTRYLSANAVGELVRLTSADDEARSAEMNVLAERVFESARALAEFESIELVDAEALFDGRRVLLQCLAPADFDATRLVTGLSQHYGVEVMLENLASEPPEPTQGGCGKPGCGHGEAGCSSCGTGGCSTCSAGQKIDLRDYFAHLRTKMESQGRVALL